MFKIEYNIMFTQSYDLIIMNILKIKKRTDLVRKQNEFPGFI